MFFFLNKLLNRLLTSLRSFAASCRRSLPSCHLLSSFARACFLMLWRSHWSVWVSVSFVSLSNLFLTFASRIPNTRRSRRISFGVIVSNSQPSASFRSRFLHTAVEFVSFEWYVLTGLAVISKFLQHRGDFLVVAFFVPVGEGWIYVSSFLADNR